MGSFVRSRPAYRAFPVFRLQSGPVPCGCSGPAPCGKLRPAPRDCSNPVPRGTPRPAAFGSTEGTVLISSARPPGGGISHARTALNAPNITGNAIVLVAKRSESHPWCAEETWLRRGHPVGKHGTARTGQAGNAFPRTVSAPHGARTWLPSFIRYRRFGNEMLQVQPRRPHQR